MPPFLAAVVQITSGTDVSSNLSVADNLIAKAAHQGAKLVVLPENFAFMGQRDTDKCALAEADGKGPIQGFLSQQARQHKLWLIGGTIPIRA